MDRGRAEWKEEGKVVKVIQRRGGGFFSGLVWLGRIGQYPLQFQGLVEVAVTLRATSYMSAHDKTCSDYHNSRL
jgi:hypothetical protein